MQRSARVTAADIARLAGVGRAAVSNWRKRYRSFPAPVGGTAGSPQFDLEQVEQWLVEQGKLPAVTAEDRLWRNLLAAEGEPAQALAAAGDHLRGARLMPAAELRPDLDALSAERGVPDTFAQLWSRFAELPAQRSVTTPDALAELMVTLAGVGGRTVLDPACGTGRLLRAAVDAGATAVYGQDNDPDATRLADLWLGFGGLSGEIRTGDSLRHDAFAELTVDAVVANLPFGLTDWGHEELGYDRRWEFGVPPRTEPELAWAQHAFAHLRPGGTSVLLMPPSAASRRAGRRIRAEFLRRGALRAVVALPPGAAAPHGIGLHLWILQRRPTPTPAVLLLDTSELDLAAAVQRAGTAVGRFLDGVEPAEPLAYPVPVIDLLDDEVDLRPSRRAPVDSPHRSVTDELRTAGGRLSALVERLPALLPGRTIEAPADTPSPSISIAELARSGAVEIIGPLRGGDDGEAVDAPLLSASDIIRRGPATAGTDRVSQRIPLRAGDVVVPMIARPVTAGVVTEDGALLGRSIYLIRPDLDTIDPWFLAGHLPTAGNERRTSSLSGTLRLDVRRAQVPRIPIAEQRHHGEVFRRLDALNDALRQATALSAEMTRLTADGLASGKLRPTENGPKEGPR
ncbi:N-6 DNA methylase [Cryptosporangium arvum]|uniref:N-6 DNA methylase n=1 Tax=Cryptosporangium arvum TaxID=80871 RepID=UPI0004BB9C41|nr:N-6 DNA methylase [Cryptosporangium arvum]